MESYPAIKRDKLGTSLVVQWRRLCLPTQLGGSSIPGWGATATAKSLQSCPTLCDPIDGSPPGSPIPGILQQEHWSGLPFPSPMQESEK